MVIIPDQTVTQEDDKYVDLQTPDVLSSIHTLSSTFILQMRDNGSFFSSSKFKENLTELHITVRTPGFKLKCN